MLLRDPLLVMVWLLSGFVRADDPTYGLTQKHKVQIAVSAKAYAEMNPPAKANPFGPPGGPMGPSAIQPADRGAGNLDFEFPYVHADLNWNGKAIGGVGLRYKGSGTYLSSMRNAKRSFKVDFDRYQAKQEWQGIRKINLNSNVMDSSQVRESLAYSLYRSMNVPASRTALADVSITVPGRFPDEFLGLYTVVEQVDKAFLTRHYKNGKGLLLKPEGIRGIPNLGNDPADYAKAFQVKLDGDDKAMPRLIAFTKLIHQANDESFRDQIGEYLDLDSFSRFLAVSAVLASYDGFLGMGHNYNLYLLPETNRFHFIPWDLDLSFGGFFFFGPPDQQVSFSIDHPHQGDNKLIERLLLMPRFQKMYRASLTKSVDRLKSPEFLSEIESIENVVKDSIAREKKATTARQEGGGGFGMPGQFGNPMPLRKWVELRTKSVTAQLEGKLKGTIPTIPAFGPPGGFGPGQPLAKPLFDRLDINKDGKVSEEEFAVGMKKLFREWDGDGRGSLDLKKITDGLQKLQPPQMGPRP